MRTHGCDVVLTVADSPPVFALGFPFSVSKNIQPRTEGGIYEFEQPS